MQRSILSSVLVMLLLIAGIPSPARAAFPELPGAISLPFPEVDGYKRVIILFESSVGSQHIDALQRIGGMQRRRFSIIPGIAAIVPESRLAALEALPGVVRVVEDQVMTIQLQQSVPQIRAPQVYAAGVTGQGVRVCVVDTGVDDGHLAIPPLVAEYDFANDDTDATDDHGHGTHVAGIIGSRDATYRGVAPGVDFMAAKVLSANGSGYTSDVIAGIDWCATQGADVINMSLGGGGSTGTCDDDPTAQAANAAVNAGVVVFAASGNNGYTNRILSPACASKVVAVGAVDKTDARTSYSNESAQVDVVAPGSSITSTYLNNGFASLTGTSMATPHAAGLGALILDANPALTPLQVQTLMQSTAVDLGTPGFDTIFAHGRIDAFAAVTATGAGEGDGGSGGGGSSVPITVFTDNFEAGFPQWIELGGVEWNPDNASGFSPGTSVAAHANQCRTQPCMLRTKNSLNLRGYQSATLAFRRFVDDQLDINEYLAVQISANGTSWTEIVRWTDGQGDDDVWHDQTYIPTGIVGGDLWIQFVTSESASFEHVGVDDVVVTAVPVGNQSPIALAGADQAVQDSDGNGTQGVTLNGAGSSDSDGSIVSYQWKEGATVLGTSTSITPTFSIGTHTLTLMVTDDDSASSTDSVVVTVAANAPPVAVAGPDQTIEDSDGNGSQVVTLNGSASSDPQGGIASYQWKEGTTVLGTTASISPSFLVGAHTLTLTVTDIGGAAATDTAVVTVTPNTLPTAHAGLDRTVGDGDNDGSATVTLDGSASIDPNGVITSYLWNEGEAVLGTSVSISPSLPLGSHTLTLTVTDTAGATATDTVVVTVIENFSPLAAAGADQTVIDTDGNGTQSVTLNASGSSDPDGTIVSYEWIEGTIILATTASISPSLPLGAHTITLTVTDNGGATASDTVVVTVAANTTPIANAGVDQTVEDTDGNGTQTVTLNASGSSDPDGAIASYEWKEGITVLGTTSSVSPLFAVGAHTVTLTVTDTSGASAADTVTVNVTPRAIPPANPTAFFDNFENDLTLWTELGEGDWQTRPPGVTIVPGSVGGNDVVHSHDCDTSCTITASIDLSRYASATLSFWRYIDLSLDTGEFLHIEVSSDGGTSWSTLASWTHRSGDDSLWHTESFNLAGFLTTGFRMRFVTRSSIFNEIVEVDDVLIQGVPL